jgi:hypothetical protein
VFQHRDEKKDVAISSNGHMFNVKTYYKPTFCALCNKLLYGLFRQVSVGVIRAVYVCMSFSPSLGVYL